ncbi:major facilitator superfamily domain-containing protein [Coprinopsis sp. MPI-PUGE-AT-0042]|nr:major facilitator superfamily domain-containing protein [Coprinopsis sp. MPI-PUGE-AT-0042]KAH6911727.1 major facilitator superfamily domain-containing protein [Coprinopsis sp. MPI-PUGE-AT-0042]
MADLEKSTATPVSVKNASKHDTFYSAASNHHAAGRREEFSEKKMVDEEAVGLSILTVPPRAYHHHRSKAFEHSNRSMMSFVSINSDDFLESAASTHTMHERREQQDRLKPALTVLGAFLALFCTFGQMNSFGTYHSWYSRHQLYGLSPSKISWIGSLQLWFFFFTGGFIGRAFDSYGPRVLMLSGTFFYALSVVTTSMSVKYWHYMLSQGLLFGLAVGLLFYPSLTSVSTHFTKYRATALGIAAAGSSFGGVLYPILLRNLFDLVGYGWAVRITGLVSALGCLAASLMVSTKYPPQAKGGPFFNMRSIMDLRFAFLVIGCCLVALGLFTPFFFIVEYARHLSISDRTSFYVLAVMNAGGIVGRIAPAYLSDRLGRFNLLFPSALFSGLSCIIGWLFTKDVTALMAFCALYGFFSGAFISLITPCVAQISDLSEIGMRIGMLYTIISVP